MPEMINCPKCGAFTTMHAKCVKCDAKVCFACYATTESQKCSGCAALFGVQPLAR